MRNISLHYAGWSMVIGESCEACLSVSAQAPRRALDIALFDAVCREIRDELLNFHAELHNKFLYDAPSPMHKVPECEPDEIRYMESEASTLPPAEVAWRRIADQNGSVRYRLPKPGE